MAPSGYEKQIYNIQLMLVPVKAPYLILCFFHYGLMTSLVMLSVILLPMLMIPLCTLSVISHLNCVEQLDLASELVSDL